MTHSPQFHTVVDAPGWWTQRLERWRGRPVSYDIRPYIPRVQEINSLESSLQELPEEDLKGQAQELRRKVQGGASLDSILCQTYALVREVARRVLHMRHFDVQLVGGMVLHEGKMLEMLTGEGKTLVAVLPAVLNALLGQGVHVLTFNDYLARRDAEWMGPIYRFLGFSVAAIGASSTTKERHRAYRADITYLTAKEAGFDYLRDGLCTDPNDRVHRHFPFAVVDEADSVLIDEARIPLVIAGSREVGALNTSMIAAWVRDLQPELHYDVEENGRNVFLTEAGLQLLEDEIGCDSLHDADNVQWLTEINLALHAKALLHRDVDYIVRDGQIELVDEFTGRVVKDRQWPDGLQAALEAKEGLRLGDEGEILNSITLQHFFVQYERLSGMTATARPEDEELSEFYGLDTVVLPPNQACIREDHPDQIFSHKAAKEEAIYKAIHEAHSQGRPVLVGTSSVRESEELARELEEQGMSCQVLNAKTDEQEAKIVAEAGAPGAITISTNMAGRGTDIRLGGADERFRDEVVAAGGLLVIGTHRHETRRIDRQLRGRAGRQGDPGSSIFFVSLEDEVMVKYGVDKLVSESLRRHRQGAIDHPLLVQRANWAQRVIEGQNHSIRRTLWNYSWIIEQQRLLMRELRDQWLEGTKLPGFWAEQRPERYNELVALCGEEQAIQLELQVALHSMDRLWVEHLQNLADIREGIYIVRLGSKDPYHEFRKAAYHVFDTLEDNINHRILEHLDGMTLTKEGLSVALQQVQGPSSTWTYMIDDNPFRDALGLNVANSIVLSIGAALYAPLYMGVALYRRFFQKKKTGQSRQIGD
ncbi:MAG: accessory Sec system translocase SecA2 [Deltaproteobacteria bacterium]|nr:MAG: accessory Sec system translocase SecA2 [Deltaproteobacteria bacterium]